MSIFSGLLSPSAATAAGFATSSFLLSPTGGATVAAAPFVGSVAVAAGSAAAGLKK